MPTWDEITPVTERTTFSRRMSVTNLLLLAHLGAFLLAGLALQIPALAPIAGALPFRRATAVGPMAWQFLTWPFAHGLEVPSIVALLLSAFLLFRWGNEMEHELGGRRLFLFYLGATIYGAAGHLAWQALRPAPEDPAMGLTAPAVAVFLLQAARAPARPVLFLMVVPIRAILAASLVALAAFVFALAWAPQGGAPAALLAACLGAVLYARAEGPLDRWFDGAEAKAARTRFLDEFEVRRQCDQILEKIQREGMNSLTPRERRILRQAAGIYGKRSEPS